ncbi:hypothetical protein Vretimale_15736 [Volvox reticuliferus]|uniref:Uncharacterized protein n=1 Tax=Volvox reticuliferus TaxID=1737510 RepID=A0A8J4FXH2_9CHLO|nr:hypothetical protein Vretifemale_18358 [Volvox reticuliferus]GIM12403.1 hypothetical protein Vretimale_15736 [Volvox reticuliferus]
MDRNNRKGARHENVHGRRPSQRFPASWGRGDDSGGDDSAPLQALKFTIARSARRRFATQDLRLVYLVVHIPCGYSSASLREILTYNHMLANRMYADVTNAVGFIAMAAVLHAF